MILNGKVSELEAAQEKRIAALETALQAIRDSTYRNAVTLRAMAARALEAA